MSFGNFLRRISFDSEKIHTDSPTSEGSEPSSTGMNAFFTSPSKIFESVNAKTGHLVSDLNQKLDISGKLDSIKQASVGTLEQVVRGTSVSRSDSKDVSQKEEISDSPSSFHDKSKMVDFDTPQYTQKSTAQFSPADQLERSKEMQTSSTAGSGSGSGGGGGGLRRQSTQNTPRPPRPPPPSTAALSRAMSLDETNLSAQMKTVRKGQSTDSQHSDDPHRKSKSSGKDRMQSLKANEETRIIQQQPGAPVIEEEENSSASEYGENGDQPIYRQESELPIPADKQANISSHVKLPSSKSAAVKDEEKSSSAYHLTSTESSATNLEEIQEFMELYVSALIIGR
ncbi:unnamed protein product [Trichobilharzia szidati]|nr:unnamed protein product [Trichobilharzia szidati]